MDYREGTREEANRHMAAHYGRNDRGGYPSPMRSCRPGCGREGTCDPCGA